MNRLTSAVLSIAAGLSSLAAPAQAQVDCPVIPSESSFALDGQSLLGPLVNSLGAPVHMNGHCGLALDAGANGQFLFRIDALEVLTVDDLHLEVPCGPLLPTPAAVDIVGLRIRISSNAFLRGPGGQVDLQTDGAILGGHLTLSLLGGQVLHQNLAGTAVVVTARTGSLTSGNAGAGVELDLPLEFELGCGNLGLLHGLGVHLDGRVLARQQYPNPAIYCAAGVNSLGCSAAISSAGIPSTTAGQSFMIRADQVRNNTAGLLFFGVNGRATLPFHGGTLCAAPPLTRTPLRLSGGSAAPADNCSGQLALDFNDWLWDQPLTSEFRLPGTQFQCQWWARDPDVASTTVFSNALEFTLGL
jgi:hypothetical protein